MDKDGRLILDEIDRDIKTAASNIRKCLEVYKKDLLAGNIELCVWIISPTTYLKLLERVKKSKLDEKIRLKIVFVRDHF